MSDTFMDDLERGDPHIADCYVLGLLDPAEERDVERQIERGGPLRKAVASARERFLELDETAVPVAPSADLWSRIASNLKEQKDGGTAQNAPTAPANDNRLPRWRFAAMAGLAAALVLAAGLAYNLTTVREPAVIAILVDDAGQTIALVEDFGNQTASVTPLTEIEIPDDRTMQVWTLPNQDLGPVSLGLLDENETTRLDDWGRLPAPQAGQLYEITFEQEGGSPTGRPTGPIVGKGLAQAPR